MTKGKILSQKEKSDRPSAFVQGILLPRRVVLQIADEVAKRLRRKTKGKKNVRPKIDHPFFLDTSAIIDGRIFDLIRLGVFDGNLVLLESVLSELKSIADSKDEIKKERGRRALKYLDEVKKIKNVKLIIVQEEEEDQKKTVDDRVIDYSKRYKGKVITCDYNLSNKAKVSNVVSIDIYEMANVLKTQAVPGESFWVKIIQKGKGEGQGIGYLPDGTMIVVEEGVDFIGKTVKVMVSRIIQREAGRILFAKIYPFNSS